MNDSDHLKHSHNQYERPNSKYICGRGSNWSKPCYEGPRPDGGCGGTYECVPIKTKEGHFECQRPEVLGGSCDEGPLPDGSCSKKHPPCVPKLALRRRRDRLALIWFGFVVFILGFLLMLSRLGLDMLSPFDPGPLSRKHATFVNEKGCVACHDAHGTTTREWFHAIGTKTDLSDNCLSCHAFQGPPARAHNIVFSERTDLQDTTCVTCHTEHRGSEFNIRTMSGNKCSVCHQTKFKSFSEDHPPFSATFPHDDRNAIQFDHTAHFGTYFKNPSVRDRALQDCLTCHSVPFATAQYVTTSGFEESCATCHQKDISKGVLTFFTSPELTKRTLSREAITDACGPILEVNLVAGGIQGIDEFESISLEELSLVTSYLLSMDADDLNAYERPIQKLMLEMAKNGVQAIKHMFDQKAINQDELEGLLQGLNSEEVRRAACAWLVNEEYESPSQGLGEGWQADLLDLRYVPMSHMDPVVRRWIEFGINQAKHAVGTENEKAARELRSRLLSKKSGVGKCMKCHVVTNQSTDSSKEDLRVEWTFHRPTHRPLTYFSHGAHLNLLGGGSEACKTCHMLNSEADYAASFETFDTAQFMSNFRGVKKETCMQCHGGSLLTAANNKVRGDCLLCHVYHNEPFLKKGSSLNL
jgi:predicted CXXCH cytochrome family protein